jgi:hypothetical protein
MPDVEFDDDFADIDPGEVKPQPGNTMSKSRTGRKPGAGRRPSAKRLSDLQERLSTQMFQAGSMIGFGLPVTGYYVAQESDNFTSAIIQLASKQTRWITALEQVADIQPGITVGRVTLGMITALSVDRRKEALEDRGERFQKLAAFMGVTAAYHAVYGGTDNGAAAGTYQPPPQQYQPVA